MRDERLTILTGDALAMLRTLPDESVQTCVTSPPYFGLRNYAMPGQIGLERTPAEYVAKLVEVFREVRRVLRSDGTLWLNLGDTYTGGNAGGDTGKSTLQGTTESQDQSKAARSGQRIGHRSSFRRDRATRQDEPHKAVDGLAAKNLIGVPWRVAFALQEDGWILRQDIIWAKPSCMPESVTDRCTKSHEYLFLLSKAQRYFYDADAIAEPVSEAMLKQVEEGYDGLGLKDYESAGVQNPSSVKARIIANARKKQRVHAGWDTKPGSHGTIHRNGRAQEVEYAPAVRMTSNKRSVWTIPTSPYSDAHFATFPPDLVKPCILAGCPVGGLVLDPFAGSGTSGMVAIELGRRAVLIELNPEYVAMIRDRCNVTPGLAL